MQLEESDVDVSVDSLSRAEGDESISFGSNSPRAYSRVESLLAEKEAGGGI